MTEPKANRLAKETSPYLLQHAYNPVDWYPWGPEALRRAETEDKPIVLSVGYAACHWCHVMERESFENEAIARLMNEHFVCIKVDREERPDIDDIYMTATVAMTGSGGWPMTVFLTPEQAPFFAGTYFPPHDMGGRPGFSTLLMRIAELWRGDRDQLFRQAGELADYIRSQSELDPPGAISAEVLDRGVAQLSRVFDPEWGGFGSAPKFPPSQALHLLLRRYADTSDPELLQMATTTLNGMKNGGIYDQLGGGFARYSTDEQWHVPHFEKMLYDNAQLARVYLEAFQVTQEHEYERITRETLDYVVREMQAPEGGYYSATDADSEGVEGKYFTFTPKQLRQILEPEETRVFCAYYDVSEAGNWEGTNVLRTLRSRKEVVDELRTSADEFAELLRRARAKTLAARAERVAPLLDDKILVSWNALMISAMAEAGRVLGEAKYVDSAKRAADCIFQTLWRDEARLLRTSRGGVAHLDAYLEDHAYLADALIDLYEATGDAHFVERSGQLIARLRRDFLDSGTGSFFQTASDHEELLVRTRDGNDGALPNANAIAARAAHRLGWHLDDPELRALGEGAIRAYAQRIERLPRAHMTSLNTIDQMLDEPVQLVFAGSWEQTAALRAEIARHYLPRRVIGHAFPEEPSKSPLLEGKTPIDGKGALYVCRNYSCQKPITSPAEVAAALEAGQSSAARPTILRSRALNGLATRDGTRAFAEAHALDADAFHPLGKSQLLISRVGFGGYRIHREMGDHHRALLLAVRNGCNLIDTAPSYTGGSSERAIGEALSELVRSGDIERGQIVVVSKVGIVEPRGGHLPDDAVEVGPGIGYCLEPEHLERELGASLERLNLEALDVYLLHNPEMLLTKLERDAAKKMLSGAFEWLQQQVDTGRIGRFGISSNALTSSSNEPHALSLAELVELNASNPGFEVIELPLNLLEQDAFRSGLVEAAAEQGWGVLANRPLNALVDDELWRLADAPERPDAPELAPNKAALAALEEEFQSQLGAVLAAVPDAEVQAERLLAWSERIGERELSSRAMWNDFERGVLAPELTRVLAGLDQAFAGKQLGQVWRSFKRRYSEQLEQCVVAARNVASGFSNRRNEPLVRALEERLGALAPGASLAQRVVHLLASLPHVSSVLVGMRDPGYAQELTASLRWKPDPDASTSLELVAQSGRSA